LTTDQAGQFVLPQDDAVTEVVALSSEGYARATPAALAAQPAMRLQPSGRFEGTLMSGGKPASGKVLDLWETKDSMDYIGYSIRTETDADGHFAFPGVPPGRFSLDQTVAVTPADGFIPNVHIASVTIHLGQTMNVSLALYPVFARLNWPASVERQADWVVIQTVDPEALSGPIGLSCNLNESDDGTWKSDELPPGNYTMHFRVFAPSEDGVQGKPLFHAELPLVIPDAPPGNAVDAGEILLQSPQ
jgi:hypothetical protein